jgi:hypothetical protein
VPSAGPHPGTASDAATGGERVRWPVDSFAELIELEQQILERIAEVPNGGYLFLLHPLMLLEQIGVVLSDDARTELLQREPELANLSPLPYVALRDCQEPQTLHCHLSGLFGRNT